jgi:hypothetical protein
VTATIFDEDGDRRPAIFVWRSEADASEEGPIAMFWLEVDPPSAA